MNVKGPFTRNVTVTVSMKFIVQILTLCLIGDSAFDEQNGSNGLNTLPDSDTDTDSDSTFCLMQN